MPHLFSELALREVVLRNRIMVSPMCQYSAKDGLANDWHFVHLGSRAIGGAGLVCVEATAVEPAGRISPGDLGLWDQAHADALRPIARFLAEHGAAPAIQLAHAGRKASVAAPWEGGAPLDATRGGWAVVGPSPDSFSPAHQVPRELTESDLAGLVEAWRRAALRALDAGFQIVEVHAAHGYLLHEFLSPLSNRRTDRFGGGFENRIRFPLQVIEAVRAVWPERLPLLVRISTTDWVDGGWDVEQSVAFCRELARRGVDLVDCSSAGLAFDAVVPAAPGFQVPNAERIRREAKIPVAAVGMITGAAQADALVREERADLIAIGREELRDPYFPLHAAQELAVKITWPPQYQRAAPSA